MVLHPKPTTGSRRRPRRGGGGLCPSSRLHPPDNLVRVQSKRLSRSLHPGASPGLIPHRQAQVSGPLPQRRFRQTPRGSQDGYLGTALEADPDVGEDSRPKLPQGPGHAHGPRTQRSGPPCSTRDRFQILTPHPSAHLEGTRGLRFWRQPHQVGETHKAMGR